MARLRRPMRSRDEYATLGGTSPATAGTPISRALDGGKRMASANAPAIVPPASRPLPTASAQKAYTPTPPGVDNRLRLPGRPPVPGPGLTPGAPAVVPRAPGSFAVGNAALSIMAPEPVGQMLYPQPDTIGPHGETVTANQARFNAMSPERQQKWQDTLDARGWARPRYRPGTQAYVNQTGIPMQEFTGEPTGPAGMSPDESRRINSLQDTYERIRTLTPSQQQDALAKRWEAWQYGQDQQRQAQTASEEQDRLSGGGSRLMGPNGFPVRAPGGGYLPATAGGSGRPLQVALGRDGKPVYMGNNPMVTLGPAPGQKPAGPRMIRMPGPDGQVTEVPDTPENRGNLRAQIHKQNLDRRFPGVPEEVANKPLQESMNLQRADSNNTKWETARQNRIAARKERQLRASAVGAQSADLRRARLAERKGGVLTNAFMKMSPEQQLDVMTGGRSGMGDARDALYLAQAEKARASADATGAWINGAGGVGAAVNGSPEAPAAVPAGSPALRSLGIADSDESDFDRIRSFVGPSGEIPPTARTKLQEWANEPLESEANGIWGRWFGMKNWPAIRVNNLKRKIRSGDWAGAAAMLKAPEAGTPGAPDYLPPAPSSPV